MTFREALPASCPPQSPRHPKQEHLWRLLRQEAASSEDFDSQYLKFPGRSFPDLCGARAVSLITSIEICRSAAKSPRLKKAAFSHAVKVKCCPSLGVWDQDKPEHVNWWPFSSVDVLAQLGSTEAL